jgi:DNA-directed RNA polymerase specialized sigma24 family protein
MSERCRLAFTRVAILGQNAAEVARELNMGVGAVHQCVSRTRDRLRKALFKSDPNSAQPAVDDSDKLGD